MLQHNFLLLKIILTHRRLSPLLREEEKCLFNRMCDWLFFYWLDLRCCCVDNMRQPHVFRFGE